MVGKVLITGGDGYLGLRLARAYLERTDKSVILWIRARDAAEFQRKHAKLGQQLAQFRNRVSCHWGDLVHEQPFREIDPKHIELIIHSAAVTRFNVDEGTARQVNIEGTHKLLDFASGCESLEGIGLLSTVYASGLKAGAIHEAPLDNASGFANYYERSKWASESELLTRFDYLPWNVFRVATIVADDAAGNVTQQNAFHNTLKLLYYGLLSLVPGNPDTPLYFVSGEFVENSVFSLMNARRPRSIYHVAHTRAQSVTLDRLIALAFETFAQDSSFESRRVLRPLYSDLESFDLLGDAMNTFGGGIVNQAISSVAPFSKQLFVDKAVQNHNLVTALGIGSAPDVDELIRNTCAYLVQTRWGTRQPPMARNDVLGSVHAGRYK